MSTTRLSIESEIKELREILASIPNENVIERISFEERLTAAEIALANAPANRILEKARLTFRGRPVIGSHGISADFASKASGAFTDAFAAVAASLNKSLNFMGPIPDKGRNQLLITGTAIGSFGFEFELPTTQEDLFPEPEKGEEALEKIQALLRTTAEGSDDDVAELVEEIHPRAVRKVAEFLSYLAQQDSWCGLEFKSRFFRFSDIQQLQSSVERLQDENIQEQQESYRGEFQGVLPGARTFEFKLSDQSGLIKGKVDPAIEDPDILNREWLHKHVQVKLHVIRVGQGRPRFTLLDLASITP